MAQNPLRESVDPAEIRAVTPQSLAWLACPVCRGGLALSGATIRCGGCGREFQITDGLPVLLP